MNNYDDYLDLEDYYISGVKNSAISVAIELNIFEDIENNSLDRANFNSHILNALIESLRSLKFIDISTTGHILTNKARTFMLKSSPFYKGGDLLRKRNIEIHERIKAALINGEASLKYANESMTKMWNHAKLDPKAAKEFTLQMHQLMSYPAHHHCAKSNIKNSREITDLGGGSGAWANELLKNNSKIKVTIFDLPEVLDVAKTIVGPQKISFIGGSFFDSVPQSEDYLLSNILHDWPLDKCNILLSNIKKSMKDGGHLYIHECLLDESRIIPTFTSLFNLLMAVNHNAQQFTFNELRTLLENNGFGELETISEVGYYQLLRCKKL